MRARGQPGRYRGALRYEGEILRMNFFKKDIRLLYCQKGILLKNILFFISLFMFFPLLLSSQGDVLLEICPIALWLPLLVAYMMSVSSHFEGEQESGFLDILRLKKYFFPYLVISKALSHWVVYGFSFSGVAWVCAISVGGVLFLSWEMFVSFLIGTLSMSFLTVFGNALVLGKRRGELAVFMVLMPFCIPLLIFSIAGMYGMMDGTFMGHLFYLQFAYLCFMLSSVPWLTGMLLKEVFENP